MYAYPKRPKDLPKKERNAPLYFILCGDPSFKTRLINADLHTGKDCLMEIKFNSKIGRMIRKKLNSTKK